MVHNSSFRKVKVARVANFIFHLQQGARKGAPQAQQVGDRFHLLLNLGDALQRLFERKQAVLQEEAQQHHAPLRPSEETDALREVTTTPAPP